MKYFVLIMRGLANFGNTCYLNFILQVLINTEEFTTLFTRYAKRSKDTDHPLYKISQSLWHLMELYLDPATSEKSLRTGLKQFIQVFRVCHQEFGYGQQDGHEYLTFLMRAIHDSMYIPREMTVSGTASSYADQLELAAIQAHRIDGSSTTELMLNSNTESSVCYDSVIFQLFTGQYRFQTQCLNKSCEHVSNRFETFRCCELPIGNHDKPNPNLFDLLKEYTSVTQLDEAYECDRCKERSRCYRRCTLWRLPPILVFSFKRGIHHYSDGQYHELKDNRVVEFPDTLDLSEFCTVPRNALYQLYATGNHMGATHGGHYYAQIKQSDGWKVADDDKIIKGRGPMEHVCLLFYRLAAS